MPRTIGTRCRMLLSLSQGVAKMWTWNQQHWRMGLDGSEMVYFIWMQRGAKGPKSIVDSWCLNFEIHRSFQYKACLVHFRCPHIIWLVGHLIDFHNFIRQEVLSLEIQIWRVCEVTSCRSVFETGVWLCGHLLSLPGGSLCYTPERS